MTSDDNPFTALKEQVEDADQSIQSAVAQNDAELKDMVDEARKNADQRAAELTTTTNETSGQADSQWDKAKDDWNEHIQHMRKDIDAKKAAHDATVAASDAESAEADAVDAVAYASSAIEEARYATLRAVMARRKASVMAAVTS
jgi:hypothetical protein